MGVVAYGLSIMQRTTLGVSGLDAAARFAISPSSLSTFVFVQIVVYVAMQIPAGLHVDRWGARRTVVTSGTISGVGQLLMAFATTMPAALLARITLGIGDALMFVALLALLPRWFPPRQVPLFTQLMTILGQGGQILSAVPFLAVLHRAGWTAAYASAGAIGLLGALLALAVVRNAPPGSWSQQEGTSPREILRQVGMVWRRPGTRLGFFGHMATQFPMMVFSLLWGVPYLVSAQHLSSAAASGLLTLCVVCSIAIGPLLGLLTQRFPLRRSWLTLGVLGATATTWAVVLALPGPAPMWLLVVLMVVLAASGPGSIVAFDITRTFNPPPNLGVAQSIVNIGGYLATLGVLALIGMVLDAAGGYTFEAFRLAWLVQYPFWAVALVGFLVNRRKTRRILAAQGIAPRPLREVVTGRRRG